MSDKIYMKTAELVLEAMQRGDLPPWKRPWTAEAWPANLATRKSYRGVNVLRLGVTAQLRGLPNRWWVSYKQAQEMGGQVRKGEKSPMMVVFFRMLQKKDSEEEFAFMTAAPVFHSSQCDGLEQWIPQENVREIQPVTAWAEFLKGLPEQPDIRYHANGGAFYRPREDWIGLPEQRLFGTDSAFVSTSAHEVGHWTGPRLGRFQRDSVDNVTFGSTSYSMEELCAEFFAAMVGGHCGVTTPQDIDRSAAYLKGWATKIKAEPKILHQAVQAAQKAFEWSCPQEKELEAAA